MDSRFRENDGCRGRRPFIGAKVSCIIRKSNSAAQPQPKGRFQVADYCKFKTVSHREEI